MTNSHGMPIIIQQMNHDIFLVKISNYFKMIKNYTPNVNKIRLYYSYIPLKDIVLIVFRV